MMQRSNNLNEKSCGRCMYIMYVLCRRQAAHYSCRARINALLASFTSQIDLITSLGSEICASQFDMYCVLNTGIPCFTVLYIRTALCHTINVGSPTTSTSRFEYLKPSVSQLIRASFIIYLSFFAPHFLLISTIKS
jgi:hypothetical protein